MTRVTTWIFVGMMFVLLRGTAVTQELDGNRLSIEKPNLPEKQSKPPGLPELEQLKINPAEDNLFIEDKLLGVVIVRARQEVVFDSPPVAGIQVKAVPILAGEDFQQVLAPYLGKPVRKSTLLQMEYDVWAYCRDRDRPLVSAIVPAGQSFTNGVVQMVFIEGRIVEILVRNQGRQWFGSNVVRRQIYQKLNLPLDAKSLEEDLNWLNQNPFREVTPNLAAGDVAGETKLVLDVNDRIPLRGFVGYEDTGNTELGMERLLTGFNWGNAWGIGDQLNYQYSADIEFKHLDAHTVSYSIPLPWRHTVDLLAAYVDAKGLSRAGDRIEGQNTLASLRYGMPLAPWWKTYRHQLTVGFDFKRIESLLVYRGDDISTPYDVLQFQFGYTASWSDRFGYTSWGLEAFYSPGGLTGRNEDRNFNQDTNIVAKADYLYCGVQLDRTTRLPKDFSWVLGLKAQFANGRLSTSEQFGLGGYGTVRGYDERENSGDQALLMRNELRLPPMELPKVASQSSQLQFLGFFDIGEVTNFKVAGDRSDPRATLASVGAGLRFTVAKNFNLRADYGFQLFETRDLDRYALSGARSRAHLGAILSF